jgi:hypothetical protein
MRLRPSPIRLRDACNWPPSWVRLGRVKGNAPKTHTGEIGILKEARYYPDCLGRIYLTIDNDGVAYVGCLSLDDEGFCETAFQHLRRCYGMAISEVGSSEIVSLPSYLDASQDLL